MTEDDRLLIRRVWQAVTTDEFRVDELLRGCIDDGGYDFHGAGLTEGTLRDVWGGATEKVDWHSIGFFAGELLAFYQAFGESFEAKHLPRWAFATLLVRDAIARGYSSWDLQYDKVLAVFRRWEDRLKPEERRSLLSIIGKPNSPDVPPVKL